MLSPFYWQDGGVPLIGMGADRARAPIITDTWFRMSAVSASLSLWI